MGHMETPEAAPPAPLPGAFDLSGGPLCLEFANTWGDRERPESDRLRSYGALLDFARQTGSVPPAQLAALAQRAAAEPAEAAAALTEALELRDAVYRLLAAEARARPGAAADLERVNDALRSALPHLRLEHRGPVYE